MRFAIPIALAFLTLSTTAPAAAVAPIQVDEVHLDPATYSLVLEDLEAIRALDFEADEGSLFEQVFGGRNTDALQTYLAERIRYIGVDQDPADSDADGTVTFASNDGPSFLNHLFHLKYASPEALAAYRPEHELFRDQTIELTSPRTGFVVLGAGYSESHLTQIQRIETLVHEARHSDCPKEPSEADLRAYAEDRIADMSPAGRACTNIHAPCPPGHKLAGELACDAHPWGAYSIGYVFADAVARFCRNCTEAQVRNALELKADNLSRLTPELQQALLAGSLPRPDMTSIR